uniref:cytochrome b n=1 Tax=Phaeovulum sp. TaxID=2934796 RepID=UPI0039E47C58
MTEPKGYSAAQIWLHWVVAGLIVLQFTLNGAMARAWNAFEKGEQIAFNPMVALHVFGGILILALVAWRLALRARRGAPPPPA